MNVRPSHLAHPVLSSPRPKSGRTGRAAVCGALLGTLLLGSLSACVSPPRPSQTAREAYSAYPTHPDWAGKPVSWSKLEDIETWLDGRGPVEYPEYVVQAELELAEGRLDLAQREVRELPGGVLDIRLRAAEKGFQALLERRDLRPLERQRAERGLAEIASLRGASPIRTASAPTPATSTLPVQPRNSWHAAAPNPRNLTPVRVPWTRITIHHSAKYTTEIGQPTVANVAHTIQDIQKVHMRDSGWGDIGYHYLIDPTGRVWQGRSLEWQGAHAGGVDGANNVGNIGICLLGDFSHERVDPRALASLERLVDTLSERFKIPHSRVYPHKHFKATECPGDALVAWVARYAAGATH